MENQQENKALEQQQQQNLALKEKEFEIAKMVWRLDMVLSYPLDESQIETWSKHILRLCPDVTAERVSEIVDKFLTGEWDFDKDKGIANIIWSIRNPTGAVWNP